MNITIITQYFPPEICAIRPYELAKEWSKSGVKVDVVTAFPNHPNGVVDKVYRGKVYLKEKINGITVHRNYIFARPGKIGRALADISFAISSVLISVFRVEKPDYIIASSPSFLSVISGYIISKLRGGKFVFEVRDLWPAVMKSLGVVKSSAIYRILEVMELYFYRHSDKIIVVTEAFKKDIVNRGIPTEKVEVVSNGFDADLFFPRECNRDILERYGLEDKFIVGYIGNHGLSQGLEQLLYIADELKDKEDIAFVLIGEGSQKAQLKELSAKMGLKNVHFISGKPKNEIAEYICSCDLAFVSLRELEVYKSFIPSKIYEIMACGVPIIAALDGEAKKILEQSSSAMLVPQDNVKEAARQVILLKEDENLRRSLAENGPRFVNNKYSRNKLSQQYINLLQKL